MKRDLFIQIGMLVPERADTHYAMMDDTGRYSDPRTATHHRGGSFPERPSVDRTACLGIGCGMHGSCARYAAVDGSSPDDPRIPFCDVSASSGYVATV